MSFINYETRRILATVVWYGPTGGGKTASLRHIFERTGSPEAETIEVGAPNGADTVYYDYLPISLGEIRGFGVTFRLFTVPGAPGYAASRCALLEHVDGLVLAADSRAHRQQENLAVLDELRGHLASWGFELEKLPLVVQCTFGDSPDALLPSQVAAPLLSGHPRETLIPIIASVPPRGIGVFETLKAIAKQILAELSKG